MALAALLFFAVLTDSAQERWAVSLFQAGVFLLAICWALFMLVRPYRLRLSVILIPLGSTVVLGLLQLTARQTQYPVATWEAVLGWGTNLVLVLLALQTLGYRSVREKFRHSLLYFGFAVSVVAVAQFFTAPGKVFGVFPTRYRALGPFLNRDHFASFVALLLPLALCKALADPRMRWAFAAIAGAMFATVVAGASRAGTILVTIEIAVLLLPAIIGERSPHRTAAGILARVVLFAAVFTAVVGWQVLWQRFQDPDPFRFRREMLYSSVAMVSERPWTGFGLGTWPTAYPGYALVDEGVYVNHAHNDWAEWAGEGGVVMLLLLAWIFAWSVKQSFRFPWGAGVVAVFLHSFVDFPLQKPSLAGLTFVLLATMAASWNDDSGRRGPVR